MKWVVRGILVVVSLAVVVVAGAVWYVWSLGADALARGKAVGWVVESESTPLSVFEQTAAKALFAETWNKAGFPCRTLANALTGQRMPMVSTQAALTMPSDTLPELTLQAGFTRVSAACQLEAHGDTALLRLWLKHAWIADYRTVAAASLALLGKPTSQLDENESARMVALLYAPKMWQQPEKWADRAELILATAQQYVWAGDQLERGDAAER